MAAAKPAGGSWQRAVKVAAPANAQADPRAGVGAIACPSAKNCILVGSYNVPGGGNVHYQALGAVEVSGSWHQATEITPPANAAANYAATLQGLACRSGTCIGVGYSYFGPTAGRAMRVKEWAGHFGAAKEIITAPADASPVANTMLQSYSCPATGYCEAVGTYTNNAGNDASLYMYLSSGGWKSGTLVPPGNAVTSGIYGPIATGVSCAGAAHCTAVGYYRDGSKNIHAMASATG